MIINSELTFSISGNSQIYSGSCKDLSHTGISFVTGSEVSVGQSLEITIESKISTFEPMKATVEVIRVETSDNKYSVACRILEFR